MKRFMLSLPGFIFTTVIGLLLIMSYAQVDQFLRRPYSEPPGTVTRSLTMDNGTKRYYRLHKPDQIPNNPSLLIALHGAGMTPWMMEVMTGLQLNHLSDRHGFIVVYPRAENFYWSISAEDDNEDIQFIETLITRLEQHVSGQFDTVGITGISNGGMIGYQLLCQSPEIDGGAMVASYFPTSVQKSCNPPGASALLAIHGTADPLIPDDDFGRSGNDIGHLRRTGRFWARQNGCAGKPNVSPVINTSAGDGTRLQHIRYKDCSKGAVSLYRLIGGGHTWPGGLQIAPEWMIGRTSEEMNAGQVIVDFLGLNDATP